MTAKSIPILFCALVAVSFGGCNSEDNVASKAAPERTWTVLSKADLADDEYWNAKEIWAPPESEVPNLIHGARQYLEKLKKTTTWDFHREKISEILTDWDKYNCQLIGYAEGGKRLIYFNFFPRTDTREDSKDWRHRLVWVFDGGSDYWRTECDYMTKEFLHFDCNGDA